MMRIGAFALAAAPAASVLNQALAILIVVLAVGLPLMVCWAALGAALRETLANPVARTRFNRAMALLLVLSTAQLLFKEARCPIPRCPARSDPRITPPLSA